MSPRKVGRPGRLVPSGHVTEPQVPMSFTGIPGNVLSAWSDTSIFTALPSPGSTRVQVVWPVS